MNLMRHRTTAVYRYKFGNYISKGNIFLKEEKERIINKKEKGIEWGGEEKNRIGEKREDRAKNSKIILVFTALNILITTYLVNSIIWVDQSSMVLENWSLLFKLQAQIEIYILVYSINMSRNCYHRLQDGVRVPHGDFIQKALEHLRQLSLEALVGVCIQNKRNSACKQGKPYYWYLMIWTKMLKIYLNKLIPKTDVETKNMTKVETYLNKDCDNLNGYGWQSSQEKRSPWNTHWQWLPGTLLGK